MLLKIEKIIESFESKKFSLTCFLAIFYSIVCLRMFLESILSNGFEIIRPSTILFHIPLYFAATISIAVLIIYWLTKENIFKILKISLFGMALILIAPIINFIFSPFKIMEFHYTLTTPEDLLKTFFTFFGSNQSIGAKTSFILIILLVAFYVFFKTQKYLKSFLAAILTYITIFATLNTPTIIYIIHSIIRGKIFKVTPADAIDWYFLSKNSALLLQFQSSREYFDVEMGSLWLVIFSILLVPLFTVIYGKIRFWAFVKNIKYTRLIPIGFVFAMGGYLAFEKLENKSIFTWQFVLFALTALASVFFIWLYSSLINDATDQEIDIETNKERPLPQKIFTAEEFKNIALFSAIISLMSAMIIGYNFFFLMLIAAILPFIYSFEPLRLRKYPIIPNLLIAMQAVVIFLAGYLLFNPNGVITSVPRDFVSIVFIATFLTSPIKDLKDYAGDKKNGILTLPTMLGIKTSKLIIGICFFLTLFIIPFALHKPNLIFLSIAFGTALFLIIQDRKLREKWIFGIIFVYVIIGYLIAF